MLMRCPYCGNSNEETTDTCGHCGQDLSATRGEWRGPETRTHEPTVPGALSARDEWDPAYRHSQSRTMSAFAPPAAYPSHMSWAITVLLLCFPPTGLVAVLFANQVGRKLALGDDDRAWRYSQLAKLWCQISLVIGLGIYVLLFLWLMAYIGKVWPY